jgi:hypothetical protein
MDNRERDKMRSNTGSTSGSDVNRNTSSRIGKDKRDSSAGFGQRSDQPEKLNEPNSRGSSSSGDRQRRRTRFESKGPAIARPFLHVVGKRFTTETRRSQSGSVASGPLWLNRFSLPRM